MGGNEGISESVNRSTASNSQRLEIFVAAVYFDNNRGKNFFLTLNFYFYIIWMIGSRSDLQLWRERRLFHVF